MNCKAGVAYDYLCVWWECGHVQFCEFGCGAELSDKRTRMVSCSLYIRYLANASSVIKGRSECKQYGRYVPNYTRGRRASLSLPARVLDFDRPGVTHEPFKCSRKCPLQECNCSGGIR
jgi:hypothetical protein